MGLVATSGTFLIRNRLEISFESRLTNNAFFNVHMHVNVSMCVNVRMHVNVSMCVNVRKRVNVSMYVNVRMRVNVSDTEGYRSQ
jgi:hypothetical protein